MLTNLLNTILLSVGMGAHLSVAPVLTKQQLLNENEVTIQQEDTNDSYTITPTLSNNGQDTRYSYLTNRTFEYFTVFNNLEGSNAICKITGKEILQDIWITDSRVNPTIYYTANINNQYNSAPYYDVNKPGVGTYTYIFKVEQYERQYNTKFKINLEYNGDLTEVIENGYKIGFAYTVYQTTQEDLSNYMDYQNTDFLNYDMTDYMKTILHNNITLQKKETKTIQTTVIDIEYGRDRAKVEYEIPLSLEATRTNYFVIPIQIAYWNTNINDDFYFKNYDPLSATNGAPTINWFTPKLLGNVFIPGTGGTEIVDIPGLTFEILTMPFTFISIAFNLTLFPGTPYEINISNLFFVLLGIAIFIFLMNMIIKAMSKG